MTTQNDEIPMTKR